jgi:putative endonuclease
MESFFVYIIYSREIDRFYVGYTTDIESRLHQHRIHVFKESYTNKSGDWDIYFLIKCSSKTQAMSIEKHIKKTKYCKKQKPQLMTEVLRNGRDSNPRPPA